MMAEMVKADESVAETIAPHGGRLINRLVHGEEADELRRRAADLPSLHLNARQLSDLELIASGALSPLEGFMARADYDSVVEEMHLANGLPWTMPITLAAGDGDVPAENTDIALYDTHGTLRGIMAVQEVYPYDKTREAREVYRTEDEAHPGVAAVYAQGEMLLGGEVTVVQLPQHSDFPE